jgi:hypothetical protein
MNETCCVKGCPSISRASRKQTLHSFPLDDAQMRKTWLEKIDLLEKFSSELRICSLHFEDRSFMKIEENGSTRSLLTTAVPLEYKVNIIFMLKSLLASLFVTLRKTENKF